ncbi:MAG: hypothetical protein ACYCPP_02680, partial [Nitrososphaerales archaeon]
MPSKDTANTRPSSFKNYRKKEYLGLLEDKNVKRWYDNLSQGSVIFADVCLRSLGRFCNSVKTTPAQY